MRFSSVQLRKVFVALALIHTGILFYILRHQKKGTEPSNPNVYTYKDQKGKEFNVTKEMQPHLDAYLRAPSVTIEELKKLQENSPTMLPQIITAVNELYLEVYVERILDLYKKLGNIPVVCYDLGLSYNGIKTLTEGLNVTIRRLDYTRYPPHVQEPHTYAWKILVIADALPRYKWILWMDASTALHVDYFSSVSRVHEMVFVRQLPFSYCVPGAGHTIVAATFPSMMQYIVAPRKQLESAMSQQAGCMIIVNTDPIKWSVMKWAILCALTSDCIAPRGEHGDGVSCPPSVFSPNTTSVCHRFDQSLMNILMNNFWSYDVRKFTSLTDMASVERSV